MFPEYSIGVRVQLFESDAIVYGLQCAEGGVHFAAAGSFVLAKDKAEIEKRIMNL